jgi:tetratricopeptide (TPR) repeat protein
MIMTTTRSRGIGLGGASMLSSCPTAVAAALWALAAAGCVRVAAPPEPPRQERVEGASTFEELLGAYDAAAAGGWDEAECRRIAAGFEALSDRRGGEPAALFDGALALRACGLDGEGARLLERASAAQAARGPGPGGGAGYAPALVVLGADAARRGDRARARELFDRARRADPRSAEAYTNLATLQREGGEWTEAQGNLRRALAVDSDQVAAYVQLALLYLDLAAQNPDMLDLTVLVCQQALARAARSDAGAATAPIHNAWGLALVRRGDVAGAVAQFDRARRLDPRLFEAHLNFGSVNISFRGYAAAADAFRAALALRPDSYEASLSLGVALRGLGRYSEARDAYSRAASLDPARPGAHYNLGVLDQDYLYGEAADEAAQRRHLESARRSLLRFLEVCDAAPGACVRAGADGPAEDLREAARRRIRDCDTLIAALGEPET